MGRDPEPRDGTGSLAHELSMDIDRQGSLGFIGGNAKKSRGERVVTT